MILLSLEGLFGSPTTNLRKQLKGQPDPVNNPKGCVTDVGYFSYLYDRKRFWVAPRLKAPGQPNIFGPNMCYSYRSSSHSWNAPPFLSPLPIESDSRVVFVHALRFVLVERILAYAHESQTRDLHVPPLVGSAPSHPRVGARGHVEASIADCTGSIRPNNQLCRLDTHAHPTSNVSTGVWLGETRVFVIIKSNFQVSIFMT